VSSHALFQAEHRPAGNARAACGLLLSLVATLLISCSQSPPANCAEEPAPPPIFPDYLGVTIPPNIAPLNFQIAAKGRAYWVTLGRESQVGFSLRNRDSFIQIDAARWRQLLAQNQGSAISLDVYVQDESSQWHHYQRSQLFVAAEPIDQYLVYRLIHTGYVMYDRMGIYQRDLTGFQENLVLENRSVDKACMNCHSFWNHDASKMLIHLRGANAGTLLVDGKFTKKLDTRAARTLSAAAYPSWHPDGRHIAFSVNRITQSFSTDFDNRIEVSDKASDLVLLDAETGELTSPPQLSTRSRENMPSWSADGKWLYFVRAPEAANYYAEITANYSLCRVAYDAAANRFGEPEILLSAESLGKSITFPRPSPDGRSLVFTASDYGYFTIFHRSADLYVLELATLKFRKLDLNSDYAESYHSWSANGRWLVFSSKRLDGLYSRPFFAYFDAAGKEHKPFVLPQQDPRHYDQFLLNYNVPELITQPVPATPAELRALAAAPAQAVQAKP
jgi:hypothetical protein